MPIANEEDALYMRKAMNVPLNDDEKQKLSRYELAKKMSAQSNSKGLMKKEDARG